MNTESIFVSIPSIEDSELIPTIFNALNSAENPDRIFIGVGYSSELNNIFTKKKLTEKFKDYPNVQFKFLNWKNNYGVSYGRLASYEFYENQDYFLQVDAHTMFDKKWDSTLIDLFKRSKNLIKEDKMVISGYPAHYHYNSSGQRLLVDNNWRLLTVKFNGGTYADRVFSDPKKAPEDHFSKLVPSWEDIDPQHLWEDYEREFLYAAKVSGGLIFGDQNFGNDYMNMYPYNYSFFEEEVLSSVELFNLGYKFVCPTSNVPIAHLYSAHINEYGGSRKFYQMSNPLAEKYKALYLEYISANYDKLRKYEEAMGVDLIQNKVVGAIKKPKNFEY